MFDTSLKEKKPDFSQLNRSAYLKCILTYRIFEKLANTEQLIGLFVTNVDISFYNA